MPELQIIGAPQSNYVWVARIACEEKGVPHRSCRLCRIRPRLMRFTRPARSRRCATATSFSPSRGRFAFTLIMPSKGLRLVPRDPVAGAQTEQWVSIVNTHVDPLLVRQYLGAYIFPRTWDGSPNRVIIDAALPKMDLQFDMLERAVASTGYLVGGSFTLADIDLLPILYYLDQWPESGEMLRQRTSLKAYLDRHMMRPSVERTTPPPFPNRNPAARQGG